MAERLLSRRARIAATAAVLIAAAAVAWWQRYAAAAVQSLAVAAAPGARLPRLAAHPAGGAVLSWVEPAPEGGHLLRVARYRERRFEAPVEVARGRDWFVNWGDFLRGTHRRGFLAGALAGAPSAGRQPLSLRHRPGPFQRRRPALGAPAGAARRCRAGRARLCRYFPADDRAAMVWLDGRANDARHTFALRTTDIERDGTATAERIVDADVCTCCWPALARTRGYLWVAYRGRTADEIRDFQLRRRTAAGWSAPIALAGEGWRIAGCPTNGVSLAARGAAGSGLVHGGRRAGASTGCFHS